MQVDVPLPVPPDENPLIHLRTFISSRVDFSPVSTGSRLQIHLAGGRFVRVRQLCEEECHEACVSYWSARLKSVKHVLLLHCLVTVAPHHISPSVGLR